MYVIKEYFDFLGTQFLKTPTHVLVDELGEWVIDSLSHP